MRKFERGYRVQHWEGATPPDKLILKGKHVYLRPLALEDADNLFQIFNRPDREFDWYYMPFGPFNNTSQVREWIGGLEGANDPNFFTMCLVNSDQPFGICSYLNIKPSAGSIEVGFIQVGADFQRSTYFTEAMYLLAKKAFQLGFRRYEWKCDALNERSRRAAHRLGFSYEGKFRQVLVVKGRNRDTKWFSIIDRDWPKLRTAFEIWLSPQNFNSNGTQKSSLSDLTRDFIETMDPDIACDRR